MTLLQEILYSIFGIFIIVGFFEWFNSTLSAIIESIVSKRDGESSNLFLLIGLIGLLLTYIWA